MKCRILSFIAAFRASGALGSALRLQKRGNLSAALEVARRGLVLLSAAYVVRSGAAESSGIVNLTILVEELALETKSQGASFTDVRDTVKLLKQLGQSAPPALSAWLPYLEGRLAS